MPMKPVAAFASFAAAAVGVVVVAALAMAHATPQATKARSKKPRRRQKKKDATLSSRGARLAQPALPYMAGVLEAFADPYDPKTGAGTILLAVAENKLCWPRLKPRLEKALASLPAWTACYGPMEGRPELKKALARFLDARVVRGAKPAVQPEHLSCAAGAGAVLSNLFLSLCEAGDAVLIPAPYYAAFDSDLRAVADLKRVPVALDAATGYALTEAALDAAYASTDGKAKALLLTNPHNPTGRVAPRAELEMVAAWCDARRVHLVSDEVYALSHFDDAAAPPFVSLGNACGGDLGERRHVVWGLSKDFGLSGLRFGCVWTQNERLLAALASAAVFSAVPGVCQAMVEDVLADDGFCDDYLRANATALRVSCAICCRVLDELRLPYFAPGAGMFLWCDLSSLLPAFVNGDDDPQKAERKLYDALRGDLKLVLTPGEAQHAADPGRFRICFAFVERNVLEVGLEKFRGWVERHRASMGPAALAGGNGLTAPAR
mmetsp:Transcript_6064/g.19123  ORF Transcript_6064/g.19123 Transcript_6064/m.19123 type:complete len:492 (+) Transcript_6064:224-1699(+)